MKRVVVLAIALVLVAMPAAAQDDDGRNFRQVAEQQELARKIDQYVDLGLQRDVATFMAIMGESGMSPAEIMLMMAMADRGDGEMLPLMMLMNAAKQDSGGKPVVLDRGDELLVFEGGTMYRIDVEAMEVVGSLNYADSGRVGDEALIRMLGEAMGDARERAQQTACLSNLKQIGLGFLMFAEDHDEFLPGEQWVEASLQYMNNPGIFVCPSRTHLPVGYAYNEKLLELNPADIPMPAKTILLFESNIGGQSPVGGPADVPPDGVHNGGVNCAFVDGHVKWLPVEETVRLLEQPIE